jgi:predicted ATPase
MTKKIVLAGSVCCGKSTIIDILKDLGYDVLEEVPRKVIREQMRIQGGCLPWVEESFYDFQNIVLKRQLDCEEKLDRDKSYFLDRGVLDMIGFFFNKGFVPPEDLFFRALEIKYDKVFFVETLSEEFFENDCERRESYIDNLKLQSMIYNLYKSSGMEMIFLSNTLSAEQRVEMILSSL